MLLNIGGSGPTTCSLRLDANLIDAAGCQVSLPVGLDVVHEQTIGSQTSMVLVFDLQGRLVRTITFSKGSASPQIIDNP